MPSPTPETQPPSAACAVFLSYAREDSAAAGRIADALRAAGVEVWFDLSELRGGDAWDQKIRTQIKECALFLPIISANTQSRTEGYFRLEWRLADRRTELMGKSKSFLVPVCIDATRDGDADVPDSFLAVQWTRLAGGEVNNAFCERVKTLLAPPTDSSRTRFIQREESAAAPVATPAPPAKQKNPPWLTALIVIVPLIVGLVLAWRVLPHPSSEPAVSKTVTPVAALPATGPRAEAQQLVAKARALVLHDQWDEATREDFALAEQFLKRAVDLDPSDGDAWAALALCSCGQIGFRYDSSQARKEAARNQAERATKLAPDSTQALFAQAYSYRYQQAAIRGEAEKLFRQLVAREPGSKLIWRTFGRTLEDMEDPAKYAEARQCYDRASALPGGDPIALRLLADNLFRVGRFAEAEKAIDQALAMRPTAGHLYLSKIEQLLLLRADLTEAQAVAAKIPAAYLFDDLGAHTASWVWLWSRQPDKCLAVLDGLPHDYLDCRYYIGPKTFLTGSAHYFAGRMDAAKADWRIALQKVEQRLASEPGATNWLLWKSQLLALLGEREAAETTLHTYEQLVHQPAGQANANTWPTYLALGRHDEVLAHFTRLLDRGTYVAILGILRHDPWLDALRGDTRFQDLLKKTEAAFAARLPASMQRPHANDGTAKTADDKSVAVLAFADNSPAHDSEYFSDGISEELLNVLGKVPGLKVPGRTSSFYFKGKNAALPEIAEKLGVAYVIEGSVQRAGEKVKISARLTKAADGFQVWTDSFTRDAKDVFAVEEEIAGLIAKNLSLKLGVSSAAATASVKPEAFELYVRARQEWNLRTTAGFDRAEDLLNRAIVLEPNFARAHAALADVWIARGQFSGGVGTFGQRAAPEQARIVAKAREALKLDPDSDEAHTSLGGAMWMEWDIPEAERELRRAIGLNPNYATAHQWLGRVLDITGQENDALAELKLATEMDPLSPIVLSNYGARLAVLGRYTEAIAVLDRALALQPNGAAAIYSKANALLGLGKINDAVTLIRQLPLDNSNNRGYRIRVLGPAGFKAEAQELLAGMDQRSLIPMFSLLLAAGRRDDALANLDTSTVGSFFAGNLLLDSVFDPIRDHPKFKQMIAELGLTEAHARAQAWRAAHPPEKITAK